MSDPYKIFGAEMSPYSVKVRAYFRYKAIPHVWLSRVEHQDEYQAHAKLPIVPLVVTPDGNAIQDSTPIMEGLDGHFPNPSIHPDDPALNFLSALLEEFGDEWGNKLMFHHRWYTDVDQIATAHVLARFMAPHEDRAAVDKIAEAVRTRMTGRGDFVGSSPETAPLISRYLDELLVLLEAHLSGRKYLLGDRPSFADFGLALQMYEASLDPTAGAIIRARTPNVLAWGYRMTDPVDHGDFETWPALAPTLQPILAYIGAYFLPWTDANAAALEAEEERFTVALPGGDYSQPPQKYHAKSLRVLRDRFAALGGLPDLNAILETADCLRWLR